MCSQRKREKDNQNKKYNEYNLKEPMKEYTKLFVEKNEEVNDIKNKKNFSLTEICLAFFLLLSFLYTCLTVLYVYHKNIIIFFYTDMKLQNQLINIFNILNLELYFEALASLLNSVIKGLSLQNEITSFTFFNFMFLMNILGLFLSFFLKWELYGFIYSNLICMILQVLYLIIFLTNKFYIKNTHKEQIFSY